jgi:hypothetical protein
VSHLEKQGTDLEGIYDKKAALIRKRIIKAEEVKKMYMKLRRYLNPQGRSSLNHIMVPDNDLPQRIAQLWRSIYDPVMRDLSIISLPRY